MSDRPPDAALAAALEEPLPGDDGEPLTTAALGERTGASDALLAAMEREGLLVPRRREEPRWTAADAGAVASGMALLDLGVPLDELLALARRHHAAMRPVAEASVDLFARFVRDPIQGSVESEERATEQVVAAYRAMLPATGTVVAHHFRRLLLAAARDRLADR